MSVSFQALLDCLSCVFTAWNADSGTATKIYNAMNTAQAQGKFDCAIVIQSGASRQAELTCAKLRTLGYRASVVDWENNQIRVSVSWEP